MVEPFRRLEDAGKKLLCGFAGEHPHAPAVHVEVNAARLINCGRGAVENLRVVPDAGSRCELTQQAFALGLPAE